MNQQLVVTMTKKRLEIGPGEHPLAGFDTMDVIERPNLTLVGNWGYETLPIPDNEYDEVYASHVLEHVCWTHTHEALREVLRILKPGGEFEVWVPDFAYIIDCYHDQRCGDKWRRNNQDGDWMTWVNGRIFTYGPGEENFHRACFDKSYLCRCLSEAGFVRIRSSQNRSRGISHGAIDLGMTARCPDA